MQTRLFDPFSFLLLTTSFFGCASKEKVEPLKDITSRWDTVSRQLIFYDANRKLLGEGTPVEYKLDQEYLIFKADKTFSTYRMNAFAFSAPYTYTNTSFSRPDNNSEAKITVFTDTQLVLVNESFADPVTAVETWTLKKH
ncbi:hypothetical protein [Hymenobacter fodinae]|uniref:Lipocalin-like protein n=1 Tax=Hymenobacter fodinae TaxID=2510796 RepID=A0A4Z0P831_9BACT|nr:hypothetical protein [Hymenobacter fodinae]TGE08339.1 hypothetical protein EU556_11525 [Hymenobacter fodinae]